MFSQFFGHYLLNNRLITSGQLNDALEKKSETRVKLGVLAINAGYMTAGQVEQVHAQQMKMDKRIGDIAVEMGFLTEEKVTELLQSQKSAHLLLGQALVDSGAMTTAGFESALLNYKAEFQLEDGDFADETAEKTREVIGGFLGLGDGQDFDFCVDYVSLLFKGLTRFVTDAFTPLAVGQVDNVTCDTAVIQNITGPFAAKTGLVCGADILPVLASLYAKEDIAEADEYAWAVVSEFLNLNNGLFAVNMSTERDTELSLEPQEIGQGVTIASDKLCLRIPVSFPFGQVDFVLALS